MAERFIETGVEIRGCPETCRIVREVDSSVLLVDASTRFNDGDELGLGAEIGISTSNCMPSAPWG